MALTNKIDAIDRGKPKLLAAGFLVNEDDSMLFETSRPYSACLICGKVFQSSLDRTAVTEFEQKNANLLRETWRTEHAKTHPQRMHDKLKESGLLCLPEAAWALAALGIIPISDMVVYQDIEDALSEAPRAPQNDVEGESKELLRKVNL